MIGIGLGPILVSQTGFHGILFFDSIANVAALYVTLTMKARLSKNNQTQNTATVASFSANFQACWGLLFLALPVWLCLGIVNVTEPKLLVERFGFSPPQISFVYALTFAFSLLFTLLYPRYVIDKSPMKAVLFGGLVMILSGTLLLFSFIDWAVFPIAAAIGFANATFNAGITHSIQKIHQAETRTSALLVSRLSMQLGLLIASFFISTTQFEQESPAVFLWVLVPSVAFFVGGTLRNMKNTNQANSVLVAIALIGFLQNKSTALAGNKPNTFEIRVPLKSIPSSLDPAKVVDASSALVQRQLYQPLYDYTETNNLVPVLAKSHSISSDGKTYNIKIDINRSLQDGTQLNATLVKQALERTIFQLGNSASWAFGDVEGFPEFTSASRQSELSGLRVTANDVLQIKLSRQFSQFLQVLTAPNFVIAVERNKKLIGTGSYSVKETTQTSMKLEKVDSAGKEAPDRILFVHSPSVEKTAQLASEGSIDLFQAAEKNADTPKNFQRINFNFLQALILIMNNTNAKFKSNKQRCAFSNAFKSAVQNEGVGWKSAGTGLPYGWDFFQSSPTTSNDSICGQQRTTVRYVNSAASFTSGQIQSLEASLSKSGCKVKFQEDTPKSLFGDLDKGKFEAALIGFIPDYLDPDAFLTPLLKTGQLYNWARFSNESMDSLLVLSREVSDQDSRIAVFKRIFAQLEQQCPISILGSQPGVLMFSNKIAAPKVSGLGFHMIDLSQLRKK